MAELTIVKEVRLFKVVDTGRENSTHRGGHCLEAVLTMHIRFYTVCSLSFEYWKTYVVINDKWSLVSGNEWTVCKNTADWTPGSSLHNPWCWHPEDGVLCLERNRQALHTGEGSEDVVQYHSGLKLYPSFMKCFFFVVFVVVSYISCDLAPGEAS